MSPAPSSFSVPTSSGSILPSIDDDDDVDDKIDGKKHHLAPFLPSCHDGDTDYGDYDDDKIDGKKHHLALYCSCHLFPCAI